MKITERIKGFLLEDKSRRIHELDTAGSYQIHRRIIEEKPILKDLYKFYFEELLKDMGPVSPDKRVVEVGAGAYNLSDLYKWVITSNSAGNDFIKAVFNAQSLPFKEGSLDAVVMINTLHHIPRPVEFFNEVSRVLKNGGVMAAVEPYFSPLGRIIYKYLHHEPVFETKPYWELPEGQTANQIMPYSIFVRDRNIFEQKFPELRVIRVTAHTSAAHLLSGGLSYRSPVPASMSRVVWKLERLLTPFSGLLALFMTVVVRKIGSQCKKP